MKWIRTALRSILLLFVLFTINSCLHRDPWIDLGNGYAIGACAWSEPCSLMYYRPGDKRPYSEWRANILDGSFILSRDGTHEMLEFKSEAEWRQAWREKNAAPGSEALPTLKGVTGYKQEGRLVIGQYESGYFLLDIDADTVEQWPNRATWEIAISSRIGRSTTYLRNPKSYWVQSRPPLISWALIIVTLLMLPWVTAPVWPRRKRPAPAHSPPCESQRTGPV